MKQLSRLSVSARHDRISEFFLFRLGFGEPLFRYCGSGQVRQLIYRGGTRLENDAAQVLEGPISLLPFRRGLFLFSHIILYNMQVALDFVQAGFNPIQSFIGALLRRGQFSEQLWQVEYLIR